MNRNFKQILQITSVFLAFVKFSIASDSTFDSPYLSKNILGKVQNISIDKLLDYKHIALTIENPFDKARFYHLITFEISRRKKDLDKKFNSQKIKYLETIEEYENDLNLTPHQYINDTPQFNHTFQTIDISEETINKELHRMQAELARTQFIAGYKYYRKQIDLYKQHIVTLRKLYKNKIIANKDNQIEYYSNFPEMYQGIKLFNDQMDDEGKMKVQRDVLGKVLSIDWKINDNSGRNRHRDFTYDKDGLLYSLTDKIDNKIVFETLFGKNKVGNDFFEYTFSSGFIPQNYNYYTEIFYKNGQPAIYKINSMNDNVIGIIYKEFDNKNHLIREVWCKGESDKILREFTSEFDPKTGNYKLIERDRNGKIVNQEIVLSNNN